MSSYSRTIRNKLGTNAEMGVWLRRVLVVALLLWIVYCLSEVFWLLFAPETEFDQSLPPVSVSAAQTSRSQVDINQITALNLFGSPQAKEQSGPVAPVINEAELNAEKSRLALKLQGVVYTPDPAGSMAFILYQNQEERYQVGDELPGGTRIELSRVLPDRVIIVNNGRYEAIWLYDESEQTNSANQRQLSRQSAAPARQAAGDPARGSAVRLANDYRERLNNNPQSLAGVIQIAPYNEDGKMKGYRISPGRDQEQFRALGLEPGDIVTGINGIELDDASKAMEAYRVLQQESEANLIILRDGNPLELNVELE